MEILAHGECFVFSFFSVLLSGCSQKPLPTEDNVIETVQGKLKSENNPYLLVILGARNPATTTHTDTHGNIHAHSMIPSWTVIWNILFILLVDKITQIG